MSDNHGTNSQQKPRGSWVRSIRIEGYDRIKDAVKAQRPDVLTSTVTPLLKKIEEMGVDGGTIDVFVDPDGVVMQMCHPAKGIVVAIPGRRKNRR